MIRVTISMDEPIAPGNSGMLCMIKVRTKTITSEKNRAAGMTFGAPKAPKPPNLSNSWDLIVTSSC
jgi:hypothetical protein